MTAALEVRGLGYELPGKREEGSGRHLVQDVSFTVAAGETLVLLGRSGSGKTTTLKLINRLLEPTAGEVVVAGERAARVPATRLRRRIGYVIQEIGLFSHFTVERNVGLVPRLEGWPPAPSRDATRTSCRVASASVWAWRAPSPPTPRCCSSMSHSARSIPSRGSSCNASFRRSRDGSTRGWSS